jgi:hypothetical protein
VPNFSPIYEYHITPAVKFGQSGFVVGFEYQYAGTYNAYDNVRCSAFGFSIGHKFRFPAIPGPKKTPNIAVFVKKVYLCPPIFGKLTINN